MTGVSDFSISTTEVGVGVRLQSCIGSEPQNHAAMLDRPRKVFVLLLVRANVEMAQGIARIDFDGGAKVRNGLIVSAFIHQSFAQAVFRDEISARNLDCMRPQRNAVPPVANLQIGKQGKSSKNKIH